jgi:hypothetical protein
MNFFQASSAMILFLQLANFVAKLGDEPLSRNNRLGAHNFLNQHCAWAPDLESILLARALKIVLQQNRPKGEVAARSKHVCCRVNCGRDLLVESLSAHDPKLTCRLHCAMSSSEGELTRRGCRL